MPYKLTFESRPGYLCANVSGENTAATVSSYLAEVFAKCRELDCQNVLIVENLSGPGLGILDIFQIVTRASQLTWSLMRVISYVDVNPEHDFKSMKFAETAARNRGLYVRVFPALAEAQVWVEEQVAKIK